MLALSASSGVPVSGTLIATFCPSNVPCGAPTTADPNFQTNYFVSGGNERLDGSFKSSSLLCNPPVP
jgi:hypothetical protein